MDEWVYDTDRINMNDWLYDDCRLENNGIIRKGCGYNKSFKYSTDYTKKINMRIISWCNNNCTGKFGWYFEDVIDKAFASSREEIINAINHRVKRKTVFTFEKKYDCFNFKIKQL